MAVGPGSRLGPYEVVGPLGAGGMGEVWRARDPRLGRDVAIKVLPAALAADPERRARFERECRLLASLNHPHVASVLGLEDAGDAPALVMELVEGPTLAERLTHDGPFEPGEALALARQVAEAVEYAHERGIVHRDLKPGNIKLTADGKVKVLDFGLAKALALDEASPSSPQLTQSPTMTAGTHAGVLLGTAAYMAPEQARGKAVDRRADIWAFGVVLYEMLTGRQLFAGETVSDTIARILEREPDWGGLPARTPARVRELLRRCLEKDAKQRLRDMGDARLELESAIASPNAGEPATARGGSGARAALVAGVALAALAGGFALHAAFGVRKAPPLHASLDVPDELVVTTMMFGRGAERSVYASARRRDGQGGGGSAVYRRAFDDFEWRLVRGSEGKQSWDLSMDGRWLYVTRPVAEGSRQLELQRIALEGSAPPVTIMPWGDGRMGWEVLPDGRVFVVERALKRFAVLDPGARGAPAWRDLKCEQQLGELDVNESLEDGKGLLVTAGYYGANGWVQSVGVIEIATGALTILEPNCASPQLMPGGRMLLTRGATLLAAPWDAGRRRLAGTPVAVMEGLRTDFTWGHSQVRTSPAGDLGIVLGASASSQRGVVLARPGAQVEPWNDEHRGFEEICDVSPDGKVAAVVAVPPGTGSYEVMLLERGRTGVRRFAAVEGEDCHNARFAPDGRQVAWMRQGSDSTTGLYLQALAPGSPPRLLIASGSLSKTDRPSSWYPDGRALLVRRYENGRAFLRRVTLAADTVAVSDVVHEAFDVDGGVIAPDGRRIAYVSYEGSEAEVVVAALGADGRAGPPVHVSRGHGEHPYWIRGGAALVWTTRARVLMTATVSPSLEASAPVKYLDLSGWIAAADAFTVLPDGSVAGVARADGEGEMRRFDLVLDYGPELARAMRRAGATGR